MSPADVDEQLKKLTAELDSQGNTTAPASSLVNKAMEVGVLRQEHPTPGRGVELFSAALQSRQQIGSVV